jgi:CelD/BcsL family acetyltransferase involved in cellulose biosynthesis
MSTAASISTALQSDPSLSEITTITDMAGFNALHRQWNSLVTAHNNSLFLRHEFLRVWYESFAARKPVRILTGWSAEKRLLAALPLMQQRGSIRGMPVKQIVALSNAHSCRFDMISENPEVAGQAFFRHLAAHHDWDVLRLTDVPEGGQAWHLYRAAMAEGFLVGAWVSQRSPYLLLPSSEQELQDCVSSQLRSNARRKLRQMEKTHVAQIERIQSPDLAPVLEDFFRVERNGWKGRHGTACDQDEETRAFYTRLAQMAAEKSWLSLFRLTLDGETAAFHYGLTYDGNYLLPKLAFREEFGDLSPGLVLMHEVLRDCIHRQLTVIDFLGTDDEWKVRWSQDVRPHYWLYVFPNTLKGRLLHRMKFKWPALAKDLLHRAGAIENNHDCRRGHAND